MRWRVGWWSGYSGEVGDGRRLLSVVASNMPSGSMVVVREEEREASIFSCKVRRLPFPIWALGLGGGDCEGAGRYLAIIDSSGDVPCTMHIECIEHAPDRRQKPRNLVGQATKSRNAHSPANSWAGMQRLTHLSRPLERATPYFHHHDMRQLFLAGLVRGARPIEVWEFLPSESTGGFGRRRKCRRLHRAIWRSCAAVAHEPVKMHILQIMHGLTLPFRMNFQVPYTPIRLNRVSVGFDFLAHPRQVPVAADRDINDHQRFGLSAHSPQNLVETPLYAKFHSVYPPRNLDPLRLLMAS
ncbi:hypothetical protein B0T18DRAFT_81670 [Schizothecium vesticola]|uniref:Uncharacterized protein n=1 Tax=Schizothecium vesticola TaxID=314040 RepID=A0AA40KAX9_9PEZI|nr:hypothetical protein B0T18DRAFT_81670 [Schizothecium vesticola]